MKVVLFILLILSFKSFAQDIDIEKVQLNLQRSIATFEIECVNEDDSINNDKIMPSTLVTCADEQVFIQNQADLYERNLDSADLNGDVSNCNQSIEEEEIGLLTGLISKTTPKVSCKDKESYKKSESCTKNLLCNGLRSILNLDRVLPEMVRKPIRNYISEKGEAISPNCLAEGEPDCISELVTSLIGSLVETGKAIWNMLEASLDTLFSPSTWFDSASDKLHAASKASFKAVKKFIRNPGKWLFDFFTNIAESTETWIKSGILCQQWEGTPHMSKCTEPLESFDCLDCEDRINGVCSAVGVIASEVGIMALTAGTGTVASVGAKVGAKVFSEISKKAALKIRQKTPKLAGNIVARVDSKYVKGTVKYTSGAVKKTHKALMASIDTFRTRIDKMKGSKAVTVVTDTVKKVSDKLADPTGLATTVAKGTIIKTAAHLRKSKNEDVQKFADEEIQLAKDARDKGGDDKKEFNDRAQTRPVRTALNVAESKYKPSHGPSGGSHNSGHTDVTSNTSGHHGQSESSNHKGDHSDKTSSDREVADAKTKNDSHSGPNDEDNDGEKNQEVEPRLAANTNPSTNAMFGITTGVTKAKSSILNPVSAVAVTADITNKVDTAVEEQEQREQQAAAKANEYANSSSRFNASTQKKSPSSIKKAKEMIAKKEISSDSDLKEVLGIDSQESTQQMLDQAQAKVAELANVYSEGNREKMVSALTNEERGITAEQANHIFNQRQQQVVAAKKYMTNTKVSESNPQRNSNTQNRLASAPSGFNQYKGAIDSYFAGKKAAQTQNESTKVLEDEIEALKEELKSPTVIDSNPVKKNVVAASKVAPNTPSKRNVNVATRAPASVRSRSNNNSRASAQAPSSFFSSSPSISHVAEEENFDHLGTLHPDVIAKNEKVKNKEASKADSVERKPASFSYKDFLAGATGDRTPPKKTNTLQSVAVDLKDIDFSKTEKDHAIKFKALLKEYRVATLVEHYESDGKEYIVYRFLNGESFGTIKSKNGGQTLINKSELAQIIGL